MKLDLLKNKKVLILGLGREGESSLRFLKKYYPHNEIAVADKLESGKSDFPSIAEYKKFLGKGYLKAINDYDVIIKTPGVNTKDLKLKNKILTSQTEIFLEKHRNKTIAVTGTKGKGITAALIYKILKKAGKKVELIGNMGNPALDFYDKKNCWFVFEISSHQLDGLKISPHIAVFLNIYPDHLDFFKTFKKYFTAKENIAAHQSKSDYFIYNKNFKELNAIKTKARKIGFCKSKNRGLREIPFKSSWFLEDINAAITVAKLLKVKQDIIQKIIKNYKPFNHRLEIVGTFKGIQFINDSAATIPEATMAALNSLKNVEIIILGGSKKGSDFKTLAKTIIDKKIKTVILFPKEGKKIWQEISKNVGQKKENLPQYFFVDRMKEAVALCFQHAQEGSICLLSPACASFSTFKDYQDRGNQFKKYIKELSPARRCTTGRERR